MTNFTASEEILFASINKTSGSLFAIDKWSFARCTDSIDVIAT
jgi:hypothetical protein